MVGGGANMIQAARPLTFVKDLVPLRNAGKAVAEWLHGLGRKPKIRLIGSGAMSPTLFREIAETLSLAECVEYTGLLRMLMRRKRPRELAAMRAACGTLDTAVAAMAEAQRAGAHATAVILAGERAAHRQGAQDVRTLFSLDGGRTLRPFDTLIERAVDPLQVYVAVRHAGYWAEGFVPLSAAPHPAATRARAALGLGIKLMQTWEYSRDILRNISNEIDPWQPHPMMAHSFGNGIGLSLEEHPILANNTLRVGPDEVVSLRVGLCDGRGQFAIVSAMVNVLAEGNELLWASPGVTP
jgi:Xaa-Pro aminopeptidase